MTGSGIGPPVPELPDVEGFRRVLSAHGTGERIDEVEVRDGGVIRGRSASDFARRLKGRVLATPERRGKWLVAPTGGPTILMHFGMTGSLAWLPAAESASEQGGTFDRVIFGLGTGQLLYRDQRKLRGLWLVANETAIATVIGDQGPDALGLTRAQLFDRLEGHRGNLKSVLMDQSVVAGLGNMLSDELLWRAGIHPTRAFGELDDIARTRLHRSLQHVLRLSVKAGLIPRRPGWLSSQRSVEDPHCPLRHGPLQTSRIGGRTSYWCPICQPIEG
jgi:formamidopyrimidine-DNA glycosylase